VEMCDRECPPRRTVSGVAARFRDSCGASRFPRARTSGGGSTLAGGLHRSRLRETVRPGCDLRQILDQSPRGDS
jgi:hypothetical protein